MKRITRPYAAYADAAAAVVALERLGVPGAEIGIVASTLDALDERAAAADNVLHKEGAGALVGGVGGLLAGLGLLTVPGLGPVVAAGWFATVLAGAVGGALTGELVGLLQAEGVSRRDAHIFGAGIRRGGALVSARVTGELFGEAETILGGREFVHVAERRTSSATGSGEGSDETDDVPARAGFRAASGRRAIAAVDA